MLAALIRQFLAGVLFGAFLVLIDPAIRGWQVVVAFGLCMPLIWSGIRLCMHSPTERDDPLPDVVSHYTDRLKIRRIERDDTAAYAEALDETTLLSSGLTPQNRFMSVALVKAPSPVGRRGQLIVSKKDSDEPVAFASITNTHPPGIWTVGMWVTPSLRGQGFGAEALAGVLQVVHDAGLCVVHIGTSADNLQAQSVIERAGCNFVETRLHKLPDGTIIDSRWYTHDASSAPWYREEPTQVTPLP